MKIMIVSDLHVCANDKLDKFGWEDRKFVTKLSLYKSVNKIDLVVFNGDTFDFYFNSEEEIKKHHPELYDFIMNTEWVILIRGNHDKELLGKAVDFARFDNLHIEHGSKGDMNENRILQFFATCWYKFTDNLCKRIPFIGNTYIEVYRSNRCRNIESTRKYGLSKLKKSSVVVMGHSHYQQVIYDNSYSPPRIFANSGSCSNGRFEGIIVNTETNAVTIVKEN